LKQNWGWVKISHTLITHTFATSHYLATSPRFATYTRCHRPSNVWKTWGNCRLKKAWKTTPNVIVTEMLCYSLCQAKSHITSFANQSGDKQKFQLLKYAEPPQPPDKELWHPLVKPEGVTKPQENPLIQEPPLQQKWLGDHSRYFAMAYSVTSMFGNMWGPKMSSQGTLFFQGCFC
jgi:hypothetical protein